MIRKLPSGKFRLYSRSKSAKTGKRKVLGTFNTRIDALKRECQIQYFKHRKNPNKERKWANDYYIKLLGKTIRSGDPWNLSLTISYINTGEKCDDCNKDYDFCQCEKCDSCKYNRCLCDLDLKLLGAMGTYLSYNDEQKVRDYAWKLAKETLSREQFRKLQSEFHNKKDRIY